MACRKGELRDEDKDAASSAMMGDALLLATMCIIGLPVDVYAKDGSIYSGIFYTASVGNDYAIILKKARMIKKGNLEANVESGSLIETLVVPAEEFVQVVAKEILLPANGITGFGEVKDIEANVDHKEWSERLEKVIKPKVSGRNKKNKNQTRYSAKSDINSSYNSTAMDGNILVSSLEHSERSDKIHEAHDFPAGGRSVTNCREEINDDIRIIPGLSDERNDHEIQGSSPNTSTVAITEKTNVEDLRKEISSSCSTTDEDLSQKESTSDNTRFTVPSSQQSNYVDSIPSVDVSSESRLSALSAAFIPSVPSKISNITRTVKASTLNPGAKVFSPTMPHHRSVPPSAVPIGATLPYVSDVHSVTPMAKAQHEVDLSSFAHSSMPVKFVSYNNMTIVNGDDEASYSEPIVGQVVTRTQPIRYSGQYHNFQTGPAYVHPSSQNVMLERVGPLVCMHPINNDVVQSGVVLSQAPSLSHLTPHQMHLPKHQGHASGQALQLCTNPPIMANGPQQFVMPTSIPISQPLFPVLRPVVVPRSNGFFNTKFT